MKDKDNVEFLQTKKAEFKKYVNSDKNDGEAFIN